MKLTVFLIVLISLIAVGCTTVPSSKERPRPFHHHSGMLENKS